MFANLNLILLVEFAVIYDIIGDLGFIYAYLAHGIAFAHGDGARRLGAEIDGYAEGRAYFVLTAIAFADGTGEVVCAGYAAFAHGAIQVVGAFRQRFLQRKHGGFVRRDCGRKAHDRARFFFELFFVVCVAKHGKKRSARAERRLDDVRHIRFACNGVGVVQLFARELGVFFKVVIGAVGYAPKLAPAEREQVLEIARRLGVERQLGFVVVAYAQILFF